MALLVSSGADLSQKSGSNSVLHLYVAFPHEARGRHALASTPLQPWSSSNPLRVLLFAMCTGARAPRFCDAVDAGFATTRPRPGEQRLWPWSRGALLWIIRETRA